MNEKQIVQGVYGFVKVIRTWFFVALGFDVLALFIYIYANAEVNRTATKKMRFSSSIDTVALGNARMLYSSILTIVCIITIIVIMLGFIWWYISATNITITDKRVYGTACMGKRVDLPMDSISAVTTTIFKGIAVSTSSGKVAFMGLTNRDTIHKLLSEQLVSRVDYSNSNKSINQTVINTTSELDEIKKLKQLLDDGIINQEEFELKKKQLLGL